MKKHQAGSETFALEERFAHELPAVDSMGRCIFDPVFARKTHTTPCCELFHIIKGKCSLVMGTSRVMAASGDTLLIPMEQPHRDEFELEQGLEVFMVFFSWKAEKDYFAFVNNALLRRIPPAAKLEVGRMFDRLGMDRSGADETHRLLVRSRVLTILLFLLQECNRVRQRSRKHPRQLSGVQRRQALMLRAKAFLEDHYREPLALDTIARALKVSPFYLSHIFSKESDFSLFAYLTALRMNRAKELLAQGALNVGEVAGSVGYDNSHYFAKVFRQHFGHTPIATVHQELDPFTRRAKEYPK